jgi:hypothetical protein
MTLHPVSTTIFMNSNISFENKKISQSIMFIVRKYNYGIGNRLKAKFEQQIETL